MMYERLVMTCIPTLMVLIGLTLVHGASSTFYLRSGELYICPTQIQMTTSDVLFFVNQTVSTIEATAEEVKQLKKRLDEMDALLKSPDKPVETNQAETEYFFFTEVKKNWFEAYEDCRIRGMALASIESNNETLELSEKLKALYLDKYIDTMETPMGEYFWLSGTELGHEGKFVWMSTGRPVTINDWTYDTDLSKTCDGGQKEHCLGIHEVYFRASVRAMSVRCCDKRQNYICERRKINQ